MDDIKAAAAGHHEEAAREYNALAKMNRDAAKHCLSGEFEKARLLATAAAETDTQANHHAMRALDLHRRHKEQVAGQRARAAAEDTARAAKRAAKQAET